MEPEKVERSIKKLFAEISRLEAELKEQHRKSETRILVAPLWVVAVLFGVYVIFRVSI